MSGLFDDLGTEGLAENEDRLGGFTLWDSDAYDCKIKVMYATKANAPSLAQCINLIADIGGKEYREQIWVTTKENKNFFINKADQTKVALPGFQIINDILLMVTGKELKAQTIEEKIVNVYDYEAKKELPKSVPVLVEATGKEITLGIIREVVDRQKKNDNTGAYENTGETREQNTVNKVFHYPSGLTVPEAKAKQDKPEFKTKWVEKNKGNTINRSKGAAGAGNKGAPPKSGGGNTPSSTPSLFGA